MTFYQNDQQLSVHPISENMNPLRKIAKNVFSLAAADIGNKILLFLFFIIAARYLGPNDFGIFSLAMAITNILVVFADFGTSSLGTREGARDYNIIRKYISNVIFFKFVYCIFVIIGGWLIINKLGYAPDKIRAVSLLFPSVIFFTFIQTFNTVFQATEKMVFIPLGKVIDGLILIGGAYLLIYFKAGSIGFIFLYTIAVFAVFIFSFAIVWKKFTHFTITYDRYYLKQLLKDVLPFAIGLIFSTFYYWNSSVFLSLWRGDTETGLFTAPLRLVLGTTFIPTAFVGAIYPVLSRIFVTSTDKLGNILERALKYMIILAVPLCLFTVISASKIIQLFYGKDYLLSANFLKILVWWGGLIYVNAVLAHFFYSINRQSVIAVQTFIAAVINVSLNILLIKGFGAIGASVAIVTAEVISMMYLLMMIIRYNSTYLKIIKKSAITLLKSLIAFIVPTILIFFSTNLNIVILGFAVLILYFLSFYVLKGFSKADLNLAKVLLGEAKSIFYGRT